MSQTEVSPMKPPLATLIGCELRNEKVEIPFLKYGHAAFAKKGEDYFLIKTDCQRIPGNSSSLFSDFAIFDGHNGVSAAIFAKENLLNNVSSAIPQDTSRYEWLQALPRALVAGFVKTDIEFQQKASDAGGRLIIASDGIWDALTSDMGAMSCRGLPAELAAKLIVKEALRSRGLKDDTTCLVVDIIPSDHPVPALTPMKKQNVLRSLIFGKETQDSMIKTSNKLAAVGVVEELFEEGSAMLAERLGKDFPAKASSGLFRCAVCQVHQPQSDGLSVNSGPYFSPTSKPWEGPILCGNCRGKKDAMEGRSLSRPTSRPTVTT